MSSEPGPSGSPAGGIRPAGHTNIDQRRLSPDRGNGVVTLWNRGLRNLRRRAGILVGRPRRSPQRLRMALDPVSPDSDHLVGHWPDDFSGPPNVWGSLLHDAEGEDRGLGPGSPESPRPVGTKKRRPVSRRRRTGNVKLVRGPDPRHGDSTYVFQIDCE